MSVSKPQPPEEEHEQQGNDTTCAPQSSTNRHDEASHQKALRSVSRRISNAAGVEHLEGFNLGEMFSEVFQKHSEDGSINKDRIVKASN